MKFRSKWQLIPMDSYTGQAIYCPVSLIEFVPQIKVLSLRRPTSQVKYYSNQLFGCGTICGTSLLEYTGLHTFFNGFVVNILKLVTLLWLTDSVREYKAAKLANSQFVAVLTFNFQIKILPRENEILFTYGSVCWIDTEIVHWKTDNTKGLENVWKTKE